MWRLERALEKVALKLRLKRRVEFDQQRGEQGRRAGPEGSQADSSGHSRCVSVRLVPS